MGVTSRLILWGFWILIPNVMRYLAVAHRVRGVNKPNLPLICLRQRETTMFFSLEQKLLPPSPLKIKHSSQKDTSVYFRALFVLSTQKLKIFFHYYLVPCCVLRGHKWNSALSRFKTVFQGFSFFSGGTEHLQSSRQCRRNLIWSTSARSRSNTWWISLRYSRSSYIWNIKFYSSTYVPVGLNIHMFSVCVRCWRWAGSFGESSGIEPPETLTRPLKIPPSLHFTLLRIHEPRGKEARDEVIPAFTIVKVVL